MLTNTTEAAVREFSAFPKKELRWSSSLLLVAQYTPLLSDSGTISYIADDPAPQQRARDFLLRIAKSEVRQVPSAWFNNLVQANIDRIAARNNISKAEADRVVVSVFEEIMSAVTMGDSVTLIGFGSFRAVESAPRTGRNPATGEAIRIPAVRKPKFVAGTYFREIVNKYEGIKDEE